MPDKEGSDDEKKSTKSVVNKKQKQFLNQEELDLTKIAEAFGGYVVESLNPKADENLRRLIRRIQDPSIKPSDVDREIRTAKAAAQTKTDRDRATVQKVLKGVEKKAEKRITAAKPGEKAAARKLLSRGTPPGGVGPTEKDPFKKTSDSIKQSPEFKDPIANIELGAIGKKGEQIRREIERETGTKIRDYGEIPFTVTPGNERPTPKLTKVKAKPIPRTFSYMKKPSPEAQKRLTAVKREIDMKNIITPDRRKKSSRVATSSPDFGEPTIPKKPKPQLEPLTGRDFKRFRKQQQVATGIKVDREIDKKIAQVATKTKAKKKIATPIVKTLGKETGEAAVKSAGKKAMRTGVARALSKQIPGVGSLIAGGEAAYRAAKGDMTGAGLSLAQAVPGLGIGAAVADVARDMKRAKGGARVGQKVATQVATALPGTKFAKKVKTAKKVKVVNPTVVGSAADTAAQAQKFIRNPKNMTAVMGAGAVLGKGIETASRKTFQSVKPKDVKGGRVGKRSAKQ